MHEPDDVEMPGPSGMNDARLRRVMRERTAMHGTGALTRRHGDHNCCTFAVVRPRADCKAARTRDLRV